MLSTQRPPTGTPSRVQMEFLGTGLVAVVGGAGEDGCSPGAGVGDDGAVGDGFGGEGYAVSGLPVDRDGGDGFFQLPGEGGLLADSGHAGTVPAGEEGGFAGLFHEVEEVVDGAGLALDYVQVAR